jgi:hypothetical protein
MRTKAERVYSICARHQTAAERPRGAEAETMLH